MSDNIGYAFPMGMDFSDDRPTAYSMGLTKREYFAAAALTGLLAEGPYRDATNGARQAVEYADALLSALGEERQDMKTEPDLNSRSVDFHTIVVDALSRAKGGDNV